jgi:hypothetical protein
MPFGAAPVRARESYFPFEFQRQSCFEFRAGQPFAAIVNRSNTAPACWLLCRPSQPDSQSANRYANGLRFNA